VITNGPTDRTGVLLGVAGRLAERVGAAVRVVHLHSPPPPGELENIRRLSPAYDGGPIADACDQLFRESRILADCTGLPATPELLIGPVDPTLTEFVRANEFDLVTASGRSTWFPQWSGDHWAEVARHRPVLVVGPGVPPAWPDPPDECGEVLVPLDGTEGAEEAIGPAVALCRMLDARLSLLRASPPELPDNPGDRAAARYLLEVARLIRRYVPAVRTIVSSARSVDAVLEVQRATRAVVSLVAPAASWLTAFFPGRLVARLLRNATAPVLIRRPSS
jgi:nucleotide-binding universal stress UspA family protein